MEDRHDAAFPHKFHSRDSLSWSISGGRTRISPRYLFVTLLVLWRLLFLVARCPCSSPADIRHDPMRDCKPITGNLARVNKWDQCLLNPKLDSTLTHLTCYSLLMLDLTIICIVKTTTHHAISPIAATVFFLFSWPKGLNKAGTEKKSVYNFFEWRMIFPRAWLAWLKPRIWDLLSEPTALTLETFLDFTMLQYLESARLRPAPNRFCLLIRLQFQSEEAGTIHLSE